MAIEKSAVREGTRWTIFGFEVDVIEVTPRSVIYVGADGVEKAGPIEAFAREACDPKTAEYKRFVREIGRLAAGPKNPADVIYDAIAHILERLGPPDPLNPVPRAPAPKPAPLIVEPPVEPDEPLEDYAVAIPAFPEEGEPLVSAYGTKKRRF